MSDWQEPRMQRVKPSLLSDFVIRKILGRSTSPLSFLSFPGWSSVPTTMDSVSTHSHNRVHDSLEDLAFLKGTGHDNGPTGEDSTFSSADGHRKPRFLWFVLAIQIVFDVVIIVTGIVYFIKEGHKDYGNPQMLYSERNFSAMALTWLIE